MYLDNVSNNSTNIFEAFSGVLNIAPIKISGIYKIFVDKNLNLYLDDYNGRKVKIDKNQKFLPQVANFLKTETSLLNFDNLKYGGFRYDKQLTYHCPLYINNLQTLPKYFQLSRIENKTITNTEDLHKYNDILLLLDLNKIGLTKIFEEIITNYDYILNFNLEDSEITINGFSILEETKIKKTFSILNNQTNQPYLEVLNNKILNTFKNEKIIFPKFINIEFEFQYENNNIPFNNFHGHFSIGEIINKTDFVDNISTVSLLEYKNKIEFKQEKIFDKIDIINFIDIISVSKIISPENKKPQLRLKINNIAVGDIFRFIHPDESIYFEYIIETNDIKETLRETLRFICNKMTNISGRNLEFSSNVKTNIITIKANIDDILIEEYELIKYNNFIFVDNGNNKFNSIKNNDIIVNDINDLNIYQKVLINNIYYDVLKYFYFDGELILRLSNFDNSIIGQNNIIEIYENKQSKLLQLKPIPYLTYNSDLKSYLQYDKKLYINNLNELFPLNEIGLIAQDKFSKVNNFNDYLPYVDDINNILSSTDLIKENLENNDINILNMYFCSPGSTAYITPNILNIDKKFYDSNGNLDYKLLDKDKIKFHWFLLKAQTPEYLINDIRALRFFTDKPKLTSRLILSEDNLDFCETIFLGVKYRLPQKYKNYQFATYLNFSDENEIELKYKFEIDDLQKTIYLSINKYLDFIDLIRGAEIENEPLIDLSFFYCVQESHNTNSQSLYAFKTGGILLCDDEISVMYQNQIINGWRVFDSNTQKWYICLKRSLFVITEPLTELFPESGDSEFYVYSSVNYNGTIHNYTSMLFTVKNIVDLKNDYIWCEDVQIKFFDTPQFFINKYNPQVINEIIQVDKNNIISSINSSNEFYGNQNIISTIIIDATEQQFKLINYDLPLSLKENYFEIFRNNNYDGNSNYSQTQSFFYFPEFTNYGWTFQDLYNQFNIESLDNVTNFSKISLFDRNQLWRIIQDILKFDIRFKHTTPKQTYNIIHQFLLSQLKEYSDLLSIEIKNPEPLEDKFVKISIIENDVNAVIWQMYPEILSKSFITTIPKVNKINRYNSPYLPYLKVLNNEIEFQSQITTNRKDVLFNIYDKDFNGLNINATGNLKEVYGNITSSLFCKNNEFSFTLIYPEEPVNILNRLKNVIILEEGIINNKNDKYISTINNNIDEYIKESYIKWLLLNTYKLDSVKNELGQKLEFLYESDYIVNLKPINFYKTRFKTAIFTFTRK
jgi:hypothetical protein